ncbi:MAG: NAD(+)/NADH kinase [Firmicutes bacterium]|nr:NAD(+)/NADH kinase [Bacillota bacterium]
MKKIVLSPNPYRDRGLVLTNRARELLERDGRETVIAPVFVDVPGDSNMVPLRRAAEDAELIISFGGDGTFLHVARQILGMRIPLLGVNVGTKGFMAGLEPEDIELVRRAAAGDYRESLRMMLDIELHRADGDVIYDCALNDAVVKSDVNCINLAVHADGTEITNFAGDGVSLLIIPRLPFAYPDAVKEKEREDYPNLREFLRSVVVPEMQIKLRQGFGRAIRTETDTCVVAVLDPRAARGRRYFQSMAEALPGMPVTGSLRAVEHFYRAHKDAGYFRLPNAG